MVSTPNMSVLGSDKIALAPVGGFAHVQLLSQAVELALHLFAALVGVYLGSGLGWVAGHSALDGLDRSG